jgi:hypothetical protein
LKTQESLRPVFAQEGCGVTFPVSLELLLGAERREAIGSRDGFGSRRLVVEDALEAEQARDRNKM